MSPRARKAFLQFTAAGALGISLFPLFTVTAAPLGDADVQRLRNRIAAVQRRLDHAVENRTDLRVELQDLAQDAARIQDDLAATRAQLRTAERRRQNLETQRGARRAELNRVRAHWAEYLRAAYIAGDSGGASDLRLLLNQEDPNEAARFSVYHRYLARERQQQLLQLQRALVAFERVESELRVHLAELAALQQDQAQRQRHLATLTRQRRAVLAELSGKIRGDTTTLIRLRADERRIARLLEEVRISVPATDANAAPVPPPNTTAPATIKLPADARFAGFKGRLPLPLTGNIRAQFGAARNADVRWKGVMLQAPAGTPVHSIFPGRVVYADWLRGFGQLVIVEHDDGYMSLYGNGQSLRKRVGDRVAAGEVIATTGNTGGFAEPGLYFEIRRNGEPRNPLEWCRASS